MLQQLYTLQGQSPEATPWSVYPRPQMRRDSYLCLNGTWQLTVQGQTRDILVPFCPESALSGVQTHYPEGTTLAYSRQFTLPEGFCRGRVLLHVGAADQTAEVYVNQAEVGSHTGGYTAFTIDITQALHAGENTLQILCTDDLTDLSQPYGKQSLRRGGMWYTPVSGLWQTVWLESVPERYIEKLTVENRGDQVTIAIFPAQEGAVTLLGKDYPLSGGRVTIQPEEPHRWSPEDPYLYEFSVQTDTDRVESYFALRTLEIRTVKGLPRLCLNGQPYFFHGLLDQGYWPDGIYTPAHPDCYSQDILAMKALGFNMLRKHIKVEPEEFYYQCDRLGMVVFQDMVNNGDYRFFRDTALPTFGLQRLPDKAMHKSPAARQRFLQTMEETVAQLSNHPSILYWTIFNEGWGQFDSHSAYDRLKALDDTRWIDATSGWFRQSRTDVDSRHIYFSPWSSLRPSDKPLVLSEFGGYACPVEGHLFNPEKAYGYKSCKTVADFQAAVEALYREKVLPAVARGLCAAVITQVSDVEDEINGFLTYDRRVNKADPAAMTRLAEALRRAIR